MKPISGYEKWIDVAEIIAVSHRQKWEIKSLLTQMYQIMGMNI